MGDADLRMQAGPHVFVSDLDAPVLAADDRHHLERALRLRAGDPLTVSNGEGAWRTAVFGDEVAVSSDVHEVAPPKYELGLGIALTKAAKPEFAVQKAAELGIDQIIVFQATHSVARWDENKRAKNQLRLRRVAREASMQSRQVRIPVVEVVATLSAIAAVSPLVRADFGGVVTNSSHRFIVIGPEGGWSEEEQANVPAVVDLGPTVLRSETAAVVAAAFMTRSRDLGALSTD